MKSTNSRSVLIAASVCLLAACGGGGGADSGSASASANGGSATPSTPGTNPATATRFADISVPAGFSWATVQTAQAATVTVTIGSRPTLGDSRVVISNFIDKDPTGSGESMPPMATDVVATALASNATGRSATAAFGVLRFPAGTQYVMVEVFDTASGARLSATKVTVASLMDASLRIDV